MNKEEALSKATYEDIEDLRIGNEVQMVRPNEAYEAMDIYAKEVAIDFRSWCMINERNECVLAKRNLSADELYNIYIKHITQ